MASNKFPKLLLRVFLSASSILLGAFLVRGQDVPKSMPEAGASDIRALTNLVRELQGQVQELNSQLRELRSREENDRAETLKLGSQLAASKEYPVFRMSDADSTATNILYSTPPISVPPPQDAQAADGAAPDGETVERITRLEENQQLAEEKIDEQSQTKVESGSKYRVRLSGIVLMGMFENRGTVDNQDFPEIAMHPYVLEAGGTFGGSLRQSQIGIDAFGPDIEGAHTSANLKFDFSGGFPDVPNGVSMGLLRLRTGTVRLDWTNTSLIAGQDELFFAPIAPTSLASLAVPALSYSGNLCNWTPQIRLVHRTALAHRSTLLLQGGILDSLSGEVPQSSYERMPTWGERSGQPAYAGRISWTVAAFSENLTIGAGGYCGRQDWGFGRNVDAWVGTFDAMIPLGNRFEFSGGFYRGRALGGLNGAIGQDALFSGPLVSPGSIIRGLDSMGGWAQLKFKPRDNFEINAALGQDNPFASELRRFPATQTVYGPLLSKNLSPVVNFIYQARSDLLFSVEYRRLQTSFLNSDSYTANHTALSVGYVF